MDGPLFLRLIDPADNVSELSFKHSDVGIYFVRHGHSGWNIVRQSKKIKAPGIASLAFNHGTVYLETKVDKTSILPPIVNGQQHVFMLPSSSDNATSGIFLRPGDQVHFDSSNVKLEFIERIGSVPTDTPQEVGTPTQNTIEVRSSDPDVDRCHHNGDHDYNSPRDVHQASNAAPFSTAHEIIEETPNGKQVAAQLLPSTNTEEDVSGIISSPSNKKDLILQSTDNKAAEAVAALDTEPNLVPKQIAQETAQDAIVDVEMADHGDLQDNPSQATDPNRGIDSEAPTESDSEQTPKPASPVEQPIKPRSAKRPSSSGEPASTPDRRSKRHKTDASPFPVSTTHSAACSGMDNPKILYSSTEISKRQGMMKFMSSRSTQSNDVADADMLCVGSGPLKTTAKLLLSLITRKTIVNDSWVVESTKAGVLIPPAPYIPTELIDSITNDRTQLFTGRTIVFTPSARTAYGTEGLKNIETIIEQAGGKTMTFKDMKLDATDANSQLTLIIGEEGDASAKKVLGKGIQVFKRDLISASVLHGRLMAHDEAMKIGKVA